MHELRRMGHGSRRQPIRYARRELAVMPDVVDRTASGARHRRSARRHSVGVRGLLVKHCPVAITVIRVNELVAGAPQTTVTAALVASPLIAR